MTELLEILGCKYPIIQGPIGQLNDPNQKQPPAKVATAS